MNATWIPIFWEPVYGTGERLMVGVVAEFQNEFIRQKIIRDDVIDALYGKQSANPKKLIDEALKISLEVIKEVGFDLAKEKSSEILGLHLGSKRITKVISINDLMRQAALLHSSLARLDAFDDLEEQDVPTQEETNKRFVTEVKDLVMERRPDLVKNFNKSGRLTEDGQLVKFGYLSPRAVLHFSVIHASRQPSGVRDARARLWELSNAKQYAHIHSAALITGIPREDDPTLGPKQKLSLSANVREIEKEADGRDMRFLPVHSSLEGALRVIEFAE